MGENEKLVRILKVLLLVCIFLLQMQTGLVLKVIVNVILIIVAFVALMIVVAFAYSFLITVAICILFLKSILQDMKKGLKEKDECK